MPFDVNEFKNLYPYRKIELSKEEKEHSDKVSKMLGLKKTVFGVERPSEFSEPRKGHGSCFGIYRYKGKEHFVGCIMSDINLALHEGVHGYFEERKIDLIDKLGPEQWEDIKHKPGLQTNLTIEEPTARIIQHHHNTPLPVCNNDDRELIDKSIKALPVELPTREGTHKAKELFISIYKHRCILPEDKDMYDSLKDVTNPLDVYNTVAKRAEEALLKRIQ